MTRTAADEAIDRYLDRLDHALTDVPSARRDELVQEIIEHIAEARWDLPDRDDQAAVLTLLERLGSPEEIAAAERESSGDAYPQAPSPATPGRDGREKLAILLLLFGGFFAGLGWLIGVALLWLSPRWRDRDKLIGTLLIPGGLATAFLVLSYVAGTAVISDGTSCSVAAIGDFTCADDPGPSLVLWLSILAVVTVVPLTSAAYLLRRLRVTRPVR
jgi:hypothetical protein